jgi:hypothetical protein
MENFSGRQSIHLVMISLQRQTPLLSSYLVLSKIEQMWKVDTWNMNLASQETMYFFLQIVLYKPAIENLCPNK